MQEQKDYVPTDGPDGNNLAWPEFGDESGNALSSFFSGIGWYCRDGAMVASSWSGTAESDYGGIRPNRLASRRKKK